MTLTQFFFNFRFPAFVVAILKPLILSARHCWRISAFLGVGMTAASADQFGNFTYTDNGTSITITGYPTAATGAVTVPDMIVSKPVTSIGPNAFQYCNRLTSVTIPGSVTSIGAYAFNLCTGLVSMTIPSGVTSIGDSALDSCTGLTSVSLPSSITSMGTYVFLSCTSLTSVTLPAGLSTVSAGTFQSCTALTSVTLPSSPTSIGGEAFKFCSKLTSLTLPTSVTSIGSGAFYGCGGLTSLVIPPNITAISPGLFTSCVGLSSLIIPPAVTTIGGFAFQACRGLTSIQIPAGVISIGTKAFDSCSSLTAITVDAANTSYSSVAGFLTNYAQTTLLICPPGKSGEITVPSGMTSIGASAFLNCTKVTGITFPVSLTTSIGDSAFRSCTALTHANFTANAPSMGLNVFFSTASGFTIYYLSTTTGFTSPTWFGYQAISTEGSTGPLASWLTSKGLPTYADLQSDSNGDGVNLLMAYALNLEPAQNLSNAIPHAIVNAGQMSLSFYSGASGVTYAAQCSSDMVHWSSAGVSYSNDGQVRTATAVPSGPICFMRLAVSY